MQWLWDNRELVLGLSFEHVRLSVLPIIIGFLACIPLGWLASRYRVARAILLPMGGILFTIPSLALFVALPAVLGTLILADSSVIVTLTIYAVAIMIRGAADGFASVSPSVLQSATAVGYSGWSRFWSVELPLAGPILLANVRIVSVSTVSLLSVAALIGKGGLGYLFVNGYQRDFPTEVMIGIVFILLIALVFDAIIVLLGRILLPWVRTVSPSGKARQGGERVATS